jgi:hypothetical protein
MYVYFVSCAANVTSAVLCLVCYVSQIFFLINTPWTKKRKKLNFNLKQKLELIEKLESLVIFTHICEEYGHLAISDIPPLN